MKATRTFQVEYQNQKWEFEVQSMSNKDNRLLMKDLGLKWNPERRDYDPDPEKAADFNLYLCLRSLKSLTVDGKSIPLKASELDEVPKAVLEYISLKAQEFNTINEKKNGG